MRITAISAFMAVCLTVSGIYLVSAQAPQDSPGKETFSKDATVLRNEADRLRKQQNWKEAFDRYEVLIADKKVHGKQSAADLRSVVECMHRIGYQTRLDSLVDTAVKSHPGDWQVLRQAAESLLQAPEHGLVADNKFERQPNGRNTGTWISVGEQDRIKALAWLIEAAHAAAGDPMEPTFAQTKELADLPKATPEELSELWLQLAQTILRQRTHQFAWRLQSRTDLAAAPDYTDAGLSTSNVARNAPVDKDNKPLLHAVPGNWADAKSDGERLRYALKKCREANTNTARRADEMWVGFLDSQFSVDTLENESFFFRSPAADDADGKESDRKRSILALHTLGEGEAIAKLATGIHRFDLPDEHNPIKIYRELSKGEDQIAAQALQALTQIFLNRRQFPEAAKVLQESIKRFGDEQNRRKTEQLNSIVQPRAAFDPVKVQAAGRGAELAMVFRNAKEARFTVREVNIEKLVADTKRHVRDLERGVQNPRFGNTGNHYPPDLLDPSALFMGRNLDDAYTGKEVASWTLKLEPRENHWDKRIEIATPIQKAGLYVVSAVLDDGPNQARTLMWISDTSIVRKNVEKGQWFYVADAITGKPLPGINLELFGYRHENPQTPNGRPRVIVSNFAKKTGSDGQVYLDEKESLNGGQWMSIARSAEGRLSVIGMEGLWNNGRMEQWFTQLKAYGVCDQPVHRPGDKLKAHFWLASAGYNPDVPSSPSAGTECTIQLMDPQGKVFWEGKKQTDEFGRISLEIDLPPSATLGLYRFQLTNAAHGWLHPNLTVRVEEFRKPEFEVKIAAPDKPVKLGDKIEARISAKYYFGSPVTDAYVNVKVTRRAYADNWFPVRPYDWCYGPGYWWTCYDTPWFPRWNLWRGCIGPTPPWFPNHGFEPPESVMDQEVTLDAKGEAVITIDSSTAAAIYGDQDHQYNISVEVRDASRRTITASGSVIAARQAFKIYSWLNRGYYRTGESGVATFQARTLSDSPIQGEGKIDLLRITYDADRNPLETLVQSWDVKTDADGRVSQKFEAAAAGQYRIRLKLKSKEGEETEGAYLFTIRGGNDSGDNYRYSGLELITDKSEYAVGEKVQLQINADRNDAVVFLFVRPSNGAYPKPQLVQLKNKSSIVEIPVAAGDQPNFFVEAITVYGGEFHTAVREIIVPPEDRVLNVAIKTDQEEYLPGAESELEVTVTDGAGKPVSGSLAIAVYDRSLEQIAPDTLPGDIREFFWKWRRSHYPQSSENLSRTTGPGWVQDLPHYQPLGIFGYTLADELDTKHDVAIRSGSKRMNERFRAKGNVMLGAPMRSTGGFGGMGGGAEGMAAGAAPAAPASGAMYGLQSLSFDAAAQASPAGSEPAQAQLRKDFADSALWLVGITSNSEGKAKAKFKMPENLGSWQIRAWALGAKTRVGSIASSVVTRKNILVRIAAPRFLVERDEVIVSGIVHNDLPDAHDVRIRFEIDGETQLELMEGEKAERVVNIKSHEQARVDWRCKATAEGKVKLRVIAETAVESDAMQIEVPIIVHGVLKTDSWAGTVRLDQEKSSVKVSIPTERRAEQSKLTVRMSPSLAAAMVDALPYMASYPYGCTEQTLNRFLPTVITQKLLREMNIDLKKVRDRRNNLNAQELGKVGDRVPGWKRFDDNPVFDAEEVAKMVEAGVRRLTDMQNQDGGWGWFSGSREYSSPHTTAVVVRGLLIARNNDAAIVPDVLERGLVWLESYQAKEVQKLRNAASKTNEYKNNPDNTDALIFNILVSAGRNTASNDIKDMQRFLFNQREVLSIYGKTLIAEAFHKLDNAEQSAAVRRNIEQFLVQDAENETAYLQDNAPWWYWYGSEIEANARYLQLLAKTDPKSPVAARLVKYLLNNRKHSTYWNSTRDTALVIEAFGDYLRASGETTGTVEAEVLLGGKRLGSVKFTPATLFETDGTIEITGHAVPSGEAELEIRRTGNGPLYWSVYSTNFTLEDEIAPAGLEVKIERRYTHLIPVQKSLELADAKAGVVNTERQAFERRPVEDLQRLPSGSLVEVELLVESKNDYEYLMIEERKAAGLEPVDTKSGYTYDTLQVYREFREKHVAFFLHRLPRGKHSLKYQLRTEAPGKFTALPAVIQAMYAPELVGNSADFDVTIIDENASAKN